MWISHMRTDPFTTYGAFCGRYWYFPKELQSETFWGPYWLSRESGWCKVSNFIFYVLMILSAFITALSQIILKKSANREHRSIFFEYLNPYVVFSYVCYAGVLVLNVFIYTKVDYRFGVVINSMSNVFVMLLSHILLKESITKKRIIGNAIIVCGILVFMLF